MNRRLLACVLVTLVASGSAPIFSARAAHAQLRNCTAPVELIVFRGSGENPTASPAPQLGDNVWFGPTLRSILDEARTLPTLDGVNLLNVPSYAPPAPLSEGGSGYPAIPVEDFLNPSELRLNPARMIESARKGADAAYAYMKQARSNPDCPIRFIVLGYSQGATAARILLNYVHDDSWIAGVFLIGDPEFRPGATYSKGGGTIGGVGGGILLPALAVLARATAGSTSAAPSSQRLSLAIVDTILPDVRLGRFIPAFSYCRPLDVVCDPGPVSALAGKEPHEAYGRDPAERRMLAEAIIDMYRAARQRPPVPSPSRLPLDVVFAMDTTSSMTPYIDEARASAQRISQQLSASSSSFRVGLVEYRDHGDEFVSRTVVPLTTSAEAFSAGLDRIEADGGNDTPEAVYSGLLMALESSWRPGVRRVVILIGDAPAHDPEPVTGYTRAQVADHYRAEMASPSGGRIGRSLPGLFAQSEPVQLHCLAADEELRSQLSGIAAATGGACLPIGSPDELATQLGASLGAATGAQPLTLRAAPTFAGWPTTLVAFNPANTPGLTYEWDFNGDGVTDRTTTTGVATHTYTTAGTATARVRARHDDREMAATTTIPVLASGEVTVPLAATAPKAGTHPTEGAEGADPVAPSAIPSPDIDPAGSSDALAVTGRPTPPLLITGLALVLLGVLARRVAARRRRARHAAR